MQHADALTVPVGDEAAELLKELLRRGCVEISEPTELQTEELSPRLRRENGEQMAARSRLQSLQNALAILDRMSYDFAQLMSSIAHVVDPDIFVIGGGCSNASDLYFGSVRKYFDELVHPAMRDVEIAKAELAEPGVLGAAFFVE